MSTASPFGVASGDYPLDLRTVLGGERYRTEGDVKHVERMILDAARGSIMVHAWLTEADGGVSLGINPERVVMLRAVRFH